MFIIALGAYLWVLPLLSPAGGDSVYGVVHDAATGDPLAGVQVEAQALGGTVTDRTGLYVIRTSGQGFQRLRFSRRGFEVFAVDVTVPDHRSLEVNVALDPVPVTLPPISVAAPSAASAGTTRVEVTEIGLRRYSLESLRSDPLVSPDDPLMAAVSEQSAGAQPGAFRPLRVHGGSGDQNLVLLDGLPVYGLAHLGGSAGAFDPDLVGRVDLHTAAPPAEYGGRLSSVLDLHLRSPDRHGVHLSGALSQVAVRQSVTAPLGTRGAFQLSVRRSYRGLFPGDVNDTEQNGFGDALLHASFAGARDRLSVYAVGGSDNLVFPTVPHLQDDQFHIGNGFDWSQRTAGLVWRHRLRSGHSLDTRVWDARARARIGWGVGSLRQDVASTVHDMGMSLELSPADPNAAAVLGLSVSRLSTRYALAAASGGARTATLRLTSAPVLLGVFGQDRWRFGRRGSVTAGLRINSVGLHGVLLEPRLSGRWDVTGRVSLFAGYSRMHQFVQSLRNEESVLDYAVGAELPLAAGAGGADAAEADQVSGAIVARIGARSTLRLDGYARSLRHLLIVPAGTTGPFAREAPVSGSGSARGVDIELTQEGPVLDLHFSLGVQKGDRRVGGQPFTPGAFRSLRLAGGAGFHVDSRTVLRLAGWVASGAPTTPIAQEVVWGTPGVLSVGSEIEGTPETVGGALNPDRLPAYWRVDAGLVKDWRIIGLGKLGTLTTSLTVSNLFDARNPLGYAILPLPGARRALYFPSRTFGVQAGWNF